MVAQANSTLHRKASTFLINCFSTSERLIKSTGQGLLQSVPSLEVSVAILYYSIFVVSIGSPSTGSPSLSTFPSGECSNDAILQYCYGYNRLQLWLLAQGLLQSVHSLQVCYAPELLWYSTCIKPIKPNILPTFQLIIAMQYIIITLSHIIKKWRETSNI